MDKKIIDEVNSVVKASPRAVERYFIKRLREADNLGFGWKVRGSAVGGGYISIKAKFYYRNDTLVSYSVFPELPDESKLKNTYANWYAPAFIVDSIEIKPFRYNDALLSTPLATYHEPYSSTSMTKAIAAYMSPESGLEYGTYGGYSSSMLQNRKNFTNLQDSLSSGQVLLMMHAVNPASRLTAIEYYLKNKKLFTNQPHIEQWIETVFRELPEVKSLQGCMGGMYNARMLVSWYSSIE
ncbi:hypothetical protein LGH70_10195 [Hymenobacter sp. BT635]|uniref:DUF4304 domain-containing protein n=1 Tax=Hymenobacter nitidus TaxID=2880929 RepID=A0ABS8AE02_9BACT|nr:hypothetical protein [Hymenobacter nitidus]MCB2377952.1 hypothetical protein [Hymenobacter nitidus]